MTDQETDDPLAAYPVRLVGGDLGSRRPDPSAKLRTRDVPGSTAILVSCVLARTLGPRLMRRLRSPDAPFLLCLQVPDRTWLDALREAGKSMLRVPRVHVWDSTARRTSGDPPIGEIVSEVTSGCAVLCVSQDVATAVPRAIRTVADAIVTLSAPEPADVAFAIGLVRDGRGPSRVPPDLGSGLELLEVAACLRPGDAPRHMVDRIVRAMAAKGSVGVDLTAPRLEDLHGYGEAAAWGRRVVADVARFRAGRLAWREVTGPAVLHGRPGTGKTLYARALARSLGAPIVPSSVSAWFRTVGGGDLGATVRNAIAAFEEARALVRTGGVAVLFIDEIDGLPNRSALDADAASWWRPVVNQVLTLVDGATSDLERIILLAATNDLGAVDPALLRPGRFGTALEVCAPSVDDLAEVVRHHLGGAACPLSTSDVASALHPFAGATQARAAAWAVEASRRARDAGRPVGLDDLVSVVLPPDRRPAASRLRVAIHEAGHAVAAWHLAGKRLVSASIVASSDTHGATTMASRDESLLARAEIEDEVVVTLSGRAADVVVGGGANAGAGGAGHAGSTSDLSLATRLLTAVHATLGLGDTLRHRGDVGVGGPGADREVAALVEADLRRLMARAQEMVVENAAEVRAVARALVDRSFLTASDIGAVIAAVRSGSVPDDAGTPPDGLGASRPPRVRRCEDPSSAT